MIPFSYTKRNHAAFQHNKIHKYTIHDQHPRAGRRTALTRALFQQAKIRETFAHRSGEAYMFPSGGGRLGVRISLHHVHMSTNHRQTRASNVSKYWSLRAGDQHTNSAAAVDLQCHSRVFELLLNFASTTPSLFSSILRHGSFV